MGRSPGSRGEMLPVVLHEGLGLCQAEDRTTEAGKGWEIAGALCFVFR